MSGIWLVPRERLLQVWPKAEKLLAKVVKPETGFDLKSVLTNLQVGHTQLWAVDNFDKGAVVTEIIVMPLHKVLWVHYLVGEDFSDWADDWVSMQEKFAKEVGCNFIEFQGRKGWAKYHDAYHAYKPEATIYRRKV